MQFEHAEYDVPFYVVAVSQEDARTFIAAHVPPIVARAHKEAILPVPDIEILDTVDASATFPDIADPLARLGAAVYRVDVRFTLEALTPQIDNSMEIVRAMASPPVPTPELYDNANRLRGSQEGSE